jgi:SOS-response transcriptional repressor LexA
MTIYDIFPENDADIQKRSIIRKTWEDLDLQEVGGGKPVVIVKDVPVFSIPLPKRCIREGSFMGKNVGDANHSQIRDGALLLIDPNDREIRSGYFYCLNLPGEGAVARQIFNLVNKFRLSCVNEKFPSVELEHEELQEYMVGNIYICVNIYDGRLGV